MRLYSVPAMCRVAQSASGATTICACSPPPWAAAVRAHDIRTSALRGLCSNCVIAIDVVVYVSLSSSTICRRRQGFRFILAPAAMTTKFRVQSPLFLRVVLPVTTSTPNPRRHNERVRSTDASAIHPIHLLPHIPCALLLYGRWFPRAHCRHVRQPPTRLVRTRLRTRSRLRRR